GGDYCRNHTFFDPHIGRAFCWDEPRRAQPGSSRDWTTPLARETAEPSPPRVLCAGREGGCGGGDPVLRTSAGDRHLSEDADYGHHVDDGGCRRLCQPQPGRRAGTVQRISAPAHLCAGDPADRGPDPERGNGTPASSVSGRLEASG